MTGPAVTVFNAEQLSGKKLSGSGPVIIALRVSDSTLLQLQHTQYRIIIIHFFTTPLAFAGLGCDVDSGFAVFRC